MKYRQTYSRGDTVEVLECGMSEQFFETSYIFTLQAEESLGTAEPVLQIMAPDRTAGECFLLFVISCH